MAAVLSFNGNDIILNAQGKITTYSGIERDAISKQKELRYLDSMKDIKIGGFSNVIKSAYGIINPILNWSNNLNSYKKSVFDRVKKHVEYKSWLKTPSRDSLMISLGPKSAKRRIFRESGKDLFEDFTDNTGDIGEVSCFPNTINDSFFRSFTTDRTKEHFPPLRTPMIFDKTIMETFLKFKKCDKYEATCMSDTTTTYIGNKKQYTYNYDIQYNSFHITGQASYPMPITQDKDIHKIEHYVIGNENKKMIFKKSSSNPDALKSAGLNEKELFVHLKEMGDVMQVIAMMAWMMYYNVNDARNTFTMTTGDSIVYLLCILLHLPCILLEFEKSDGDKPRSRSLMRYLPIALSVEQRADAVKSDIESFNNKILDIIQNIKASGYVVYISKSEYVIISEDFLNTVSNKITELNTTLDKNIAGIKTENIDRPFEFELKQKYKVNELFYYKNGKYFALAFCTTYTSDVSRSDNLFNGHNKRKFTEICQMNKSRYSGGEGEDTTDDNENYEYSSHNYEEEYDKACKVVTDDIMEIMQKIYKYDDKDEVEYKSYSMFIVLAHSFDLQNAVVYGNEMKNMIIKIIKATKTEPEPSGFTRAYQFIKGNIKDLMKIPIVKSEKSKKASKSKTRKIIPNIFPNIFLKGNKKSKGNSMDIDTQEKEPDHKKFQVERISLI